MTALTFRILSLDFITNDGGFPRAAQYDWDTVVDDVLAVYESVRVDGETVSEDLRGQALGRFAVRPSFTRSRRNGEDA